ncbi:hypothetical protein QYE76_020913 [Lolium multiflorum]|uniref:CCHC-type domain-containing protein n=1 Tax=Lolium multiflorum TaxID=4521 RepID=A0AAD8VRS0_LOLMU|nr:hypothetical protein QYE76_020913 [Lolium multiflorum]
MGVHRVAEAIPRGPLTPEEDKAFGDATVIFVGAVLSVLGDKLVDAYLHIRNGKELWDALDAKFGVDAGVCRDALSLSFPFMEELCHFFETSRHEFSVENIMGSLDVEEKARAKDKHTGGTEGRSAANMVQKNAHKSKGKNKGVSQTTNFKKKGKTEKKDPCWVCGETGHWANRCPQRKGKKCQAGQNSNSVSMVIGNTEEGTTGFLVVKSGVDDMNVGTIFESRDATFFEDIFPMRDMHGMSSWESDPIHETPMESDEESDDESSDSDEDDNEAPTRSKRQRTAKSFGNDFIVYLVDDTPTTISEALASPDADYWKEAVQSEMDSILANGTWELTERPYGCKPVGCKWVFKKKLRADGTIEKYKARLVAKGYTQKEGEDFFDTYSPVARLTTIRVLLSLAASHGLLVHQMDVKTAFLNEELDEEIYMEQPDGFVLEGQERKVCKLKKSLYGLKQAPKQWHEKFERTLTSVGFVVNEADKCVYYRHGGGEGVVLCLYVDDILIFGTSLKVIEEVKTFLSQCFEMKDLGEADVILNIKLLRDGNNGITLVQSHYVEKVLSRFGYADCKSSLTPYDPSVLLRKNEKATKNQLRYSQIIGSLMYLACATRPDISFAVCKLSRFVANPGDDHWHALERVMRYLKGTMSYGIHYTGYPRGLEGYSDSNWISDAKMKATSGYVFTLGGGAVSWKSCKQTILTRSTMEAELTALDTAIVEAEWLRELLMDLPMVEKPIPAILMNCDNQTVIVKVKSSKDNMKSSKHIKRRLKSVRKRTPE